MGNYSVADALTIFVATTLLAFFMVVPGYTLGWLFDLLEFRKQDLPQQLVISTPLSIALSPIVSYWIGKFVSMRAIWLVYTALLCGFVVLVGHNLRTRNSNWHGPVAILAVTGTWALLAILLLSDLQIGKRLYFPTVAFDYNLRAAFTSALSRDGVPPANPLFFPGRAVPLRYHFLWLIPASLVNRAGEPWISARQALIASGIWSDIGLIASIPLFLKFFIGHEGRTLWRKSIIGIGLLAVTGLDIFPTLALRAAGIVNPTIEWWNDPVMAWVHAFLWVPHHVAGLVACLTGFLIIWKANKTSTRPTWLFAAVAAGLAFATAVGTSVHVTFVFAMFLASWTIVLLYQRQNRGALLLVMSGASALVFAAPYLLQLRTATTASTIQTGGQVLQFSVRGFAGLSLSPVTRFALLPVSYFLELGFFFVVVALWFVKRRTLRQRFKPEELTGALMVVTTLLLCSFVRSSTIAYNDLGWRGFLVAQFMLLIWGVEILDDLRGQPEPTTGNVTLHKPAVKFFVVSLLVIGIAGSVYELAITRLYGILEDTEGSRVVFTKELVYSQDHKLGQRTYAMRQAYQWLRRTTPSNAIVQHNPGGQQYWGDVFYGLYGDRQSAAGVKGCGAVFGGDAALCPEIIQPIERMFDRPNDFDLSAVARLCRKLSIDYLVLKDTDPAWSTTAGWPSHASPVFSNSFVRIYGCADQHN